MNKKHAVLLVLIAAILLFHTGCYGSFNLTRSLHDWNGRLDGKWRQVADRHNRLRPYRWRDWRIVG